jgi:hypothetical protein
MSYEALVSLIRYRRSDPWVRQGQALQHVPFNASWTYWRTFVWTDGNAIVGASSLWEAPEEPMTAVLRAGSKPPTLDMMQQGNHMFGIFWLHGCSG